MTYLLEPIGFSEADNRAFLALLAAPRATATELAEELGVPVDTARRALGRLVDSGLATRLASRPTRFVAAHPESAVDTLVTRRQQELVRLQGEIREVATKLGATTTGAGTDVVELIEGAEAIQHQAANLVLSAVEELLFVDAPPYMSGKPVLNEPEMVALSRSVRCRTIYHAPSLQDPEVLRALRTAVDAGEEARSLPSAQMKMMIADRRSAMLPMTVTDIGKPSFLLVRSSPLLDALVGWFESLWTQSAPVITDSAMTLPPPKAGTADATRARIASRDRDLLALLASGAKDRAIARTLGVTERTVSRRIAELMVLLSADTRFQAGLQAARLGWL